MWRHAIAKIPRRRLAVGRAGQRGPACEGNSSESEWARHDPSSGEEKSGKGRHVYCIPSLIITIGASRILTGIFAADPTFQGEQ
ncbi:hypothetical protein TorRG33x02_221850 [Trema orientale]|uniref:Uncharacterized protein n=1 Tax=Trema orientale TaxID=63057 RepID=A0A2P5E939_TREOI|nr:hypothetical protein TorRG33x02_221850 [Trema orientale]